MRLFGSDIVVAGADLRHCVLIASAPAYIIRLTTLDSNFLTARISLRIHHNEKHNPLYPMPSGEISPAGSGVMDCAYLLCRIKNALAVGETAGRFDYHKSMELTGLR